MGLDEIGMGKLREKGADMGLDFPRDPDDALRLSIEYWSSMHRRTLLTGGPLAIAAYQTPVNRWLANPTDPPLPRQGGRRVGRADLDELWLAAEDARRWDSKFGGGNVMASSVVECLQNRAAPLLRGTFTETIGTELFTATAELARIAAWAAVDMGHHDVAQQHFIQALRLARSAGDVQAGSYVLATMSLHAFLRGHLSEAIDMAEGAYERAKHSAAPRVLAFARLAEARAHGRARDAKSAARALAASEDLLSSIRPGTRDPEWVSYLTHARIISDAAEIYRDLGNLKAAQRWSQQADAMPAGVYTRAVGIRLAVMAAAHVQAGNLDRGLDMGERSVEILAQVRSVRAHDYVRRLTSTLEPWHSEANREFIHHSTTALAQV
ncbi:sporulation protein [Streptomyces sp. NPDC002073]